jgi:hypothetical protein
MVPPLVMALLVREKPLVLVGLEFTVVGADGEDEAGVIEAGAVVLDDRGTVDEVFGAIDGVAVGVGAGAEVAAVGLKAVVMGAAVRGAGAGRGLAFGLGTFRGATFKPEVFKPEVFNPEVFNAAEADAMLPVVTEVRAIIVANQRDALRFVSTGVEGEVGEVPCFVMTSRYGVTLNRRWESRNSFRQLLQRFLRLGS